MISFIVQEKDARKQGFNSLARIATRFFETFSPFVCGIEMLVYRRDAVRIWLDLNTDDSGQMEGQLKMLNAFINPWTGGQNTAEVVADDFTKFGHPRLK